MSERIGIDLGGTKIEGILLDGSETRIRRRVPTPQAEGYDAILGAIRTLVDELERESRDNPPVGICSPGSLSPHTDLLRNSNTLCLNDRPFKIDIEATLGRPVALANDANCFALAEARLGAARGYRSVFGVILGTGVGGGIVIDGAARHGHLGIAGEWGHHTLHPGGRPCYCGRQGCVETYLSGPALERRWRELTGQDAPVAEIVARGGGEAPEPFESWRSELLANFGIALANVINILDPEAVVLGGGVSNVPLLYDEGTEAVHANTFSDVADTPILENELGDSAGVFGAALLA